MKTLIACVVSLLAGLVVGCYVGHRSARHETTEAVEQMMQTIESQERVQAASAIRAIGLIESGETHQAVRLLSIPIANYYSWYAHAGTNDERSTRLRAQIEQLARTNRVLAARIKDASTNYSRKTP